MQSHRNIYTITNLIIGLTLLAYFIQISIENSGILFGLNLYFFQEGFYHQIISTMFMHGGIEHLFMNMIVLWQFGNLLEYSIGKFEYKIPVSQLKITPVQKFVLKKQGISLIQPNNIYDNKTKASIIFIINLH